LQPLTKLRQTNALDSTLRHEFLHMIVESNAHPNTPLWLREGLVIYLADPERAKPMPTSTATLSSRLKSAHTEAELRSAYRECAGAVAEAVRRNGLPTVLGWVKSGVPSEQTVH
jgi:stage II sporulation protein D